MQAANKGFFTHHDFLRVRFSDIKLEAAKYHHSRAGDYTKGHTVSLEETKLVGIWNALQRCSNGDPVLMAPISRGSVEIVCEYRGVVTRI